MFFNYILDCFILVNFIRREPDRIDKEIMITSIDAFNRNHRPKGKKQTLGITIGYDGAIFHIVPTMKFNQTNVRAFYGTYQEYLEDFEIACDAIMEQMTPEEAYIGMEVRA